MIQHPTPEDKFAEKGINLANQGKLDEAIKFFKKSLHYVKNPQVLYFLALSYQLKGNLKEAQKYYQEAVSLKPNYSMAHNNLGVIYLEQKKYSKSEYHFKKSIESDESNSFAYNNLGNAYKKMRENKKAEKEWKKAISLFPNLPEPYNNLGILYYETGKHQKSINYLKKAAKLDPNYIQPYYHLGVVLAKIKKFQSAAFYLEKYLEKANPDPNSLGLLANSYLNSGQVKKAQEKFEEALVIAPDDPFLLNDLGNLYKQIGDLEKAEKHYLKALKIMPKLEGALNNLGTVYFNRKQYQKAINTFRKAIEINQNLSTAHYHLGLIFERQGKFKLAAHHLVKAYQIGPNLGEALNVIVYLTMQGCLFDKYEFYAQKLDELTKLETKEKIKVSESPFLNMARKENPKEHFLIAQQKSKEIQEDIKGLGTKFYFTKKKKTKITLGYLSNDFYDHATTHLITRLFELHNRKKFKVNIYSYGRDDKSIYRERVKKSADIFRDIALSSFTESAKIINKDGVDILIDLKGHTRDSRLEIMALRPAPVQIHYLGYPGTTGAKYIDYFITDNVLTKEDDKKYFSERLIFLPNSYQINDNKRKIWSGEITKEEMSIPKNKFVYCSFNQSYKINKETFEAWCSILTRNPNSVLVLLENNQYAPKELKKEAEKRNINPKRLVFVPPLPQEKHLKRITLCDVALDPFICGGHTTTSDALWAGVPVITLYGKHFASRVASSLLSAVGLPELITKTKDEYVNLAISLANSPEKLKKLKEKLEKNKKTKPLFNTELFTRNLEKAYEKVWEIYQKGEKAKDIMIDDYKINI